MLGGADMYAVVRHQDWLSQSVHLALYEIRQFLKTDLSYERKVLKDVLNKLLFIIYETF